MNARIQVEHTVTEMRADRDLLKHNYICCYYNKLPFSQEDCIQWSCNRGTYQR